MPKGIEEHSGNPLAKEVMSDQEVTEFAGRAENQRKSEKNCPNTTRSLHKIP